MSTQLPPMPDRTTGEPRPPQAPILNPSNEKPQPFHRRKVPQPPEGEGPPLEWHYGDARAYRWIGGITAILLMAFLTGKNLLDSSEYLWFTDWRLWLVVLAGVLLMIWTTRNTRMSAGADWLMERNVFVKTYELTSVQVKKDFGDGELILEDRSGHQLSQSLVWLRSNEALWDLVYNGIRHSVANGAQVNRMAVDRLSLYEMLALREERWFDQRSE